MCRSGKEGHLVFVNPDGKKNLFVKDGRITFAEASAQHYQLREFLLKRGTISAWEYDELGKSVKPGKRFGALLVEAGLLSVDELVPAVVGQLTEIILQAVYPNRDRLLLQRDHAFTTRVDYAEGPHRADRRRRDPPRRQLVANRRRESAT